MIFFSASKVPTALISPMVPMEMRSSSGIPVFSKRRAMNTTSRRLCSISVRRAASSCSLRRRARARSSSGERGGGRGSGPPI